MNTHRIIRERLLLRAGLAKPPPPRHTLADLERSEWSPEFERLMRNRLIMGALRYGKLGTAGKPRYDRITSIFKRLSEYQAVGNLELLVDAANLCLCEFVEGRHPRRHFRAADDESHVPIISSADSADCAASNSSARAEQKAGVSGETANSDKV